MTSTNLRRVAAGLVPVAALAAGVWLAPDTAAPSEELTAPLVGPDVVIEALASSLPARPALTDEIDHFRARLASRGSEAFSHRRLASAYLLRYRGYGEAEDLASVQRHLEAAAGETPSAADLSLQASLYLTRHEFKRALDAARAADRMTRGADPDIRLRLFDGYLASGRLEEARALLTGRVDTTSVAWMSRRARILDVDGDVERARDLFRGVARDVAAYAEPAAVQSWATVELGRFEHHAGDPIRAVELYLRALELLPGGPAALVGLAEIAYGVDRNLDVAATLYRRALAHGAHLDLLPTLATIEEERGQAGEAARLRSDFVRRARATPEAERLYRRPLALMLADDSSTACEALRLARADLADRQDAGSWDVLAWALYQTAQPRHALAAAREATSGVRPEPGTALRAGVIEQAVGAREEARRLLRIARDGASELSTDEARLVASLLDGVPPPAPVRPAGCDRSLVPGQVG